MMHDWGFGWGWGGGMLFGPFLMVVGFLLLIALVVLMIRWLNGGGGSPSVRVRSAREILDERFARGEIQRDEYEQRRNALNSG